MTEIPVTGIPFVVVANHEKIYYGLLWIPTSSLIVYSPILIQDRDELGIRLGYPDINYRKLSDPRSDKRIYEALFYIPGNNRASQ